MPSLQERGQGPNHELSPNCTVELRLQAANEGASFKTMQVCPDGDSQKLGWFPAWATDF